MALNQRSAPVALGLLLGLPIGLLIAGEDSAASAQQTQPQEALSANALPADSGQANPLPESNPDFDNAAQTALFEQLVDQWRGTIAEMREVSIRFNNGTEAEEREFQERYRALEIAGRAQFDQAYRVALGLVENAPRENFTAAQFLLMAVHYRFMRDWYEQTGEGAEMLLKLHIEDPKLAEIAGVSYFATCQFDKAEQYLSQAEMMPKMDEKSVGLRSAIADLRTLWQRELEQRAADAQRDDLPRVQLTTTRGDIVLELFEDQAPNTVANFIRLVEDGQYTNAPFYQVVEGRIAVAGDALGGRSRGLGFTIPDENQSPDARALFRGSVVMAKVPLPEAGPRKMVPDSASSHFAIGVVPLVPVHEEHTVFARIIEGMPALSVLTRVDPTKKKDEDAPADVPDLILDAKVIRKRDHPYEPERIGQAPPAKNPL